MKRWVCPQCHAGKLAPERPNKLDVRRWCLPCSNKTGKLVERECPSLDRERDNKRQRAAAKRRQRSARDRERKRARETFHGVHIPTLVTDWCTVFVTLGYDRMKRVPEVQMRRSRRCSYSSGHAWYHSHRIICTLGTDKADALVTVLHELCHLAVRDDPEDYQGYRHHGDQFNRALRDMALAIWSIEVAVDEGGGGYGPTRALSGLLRQRLLSAQKS